MFIQLKQATTQKSRNRNYLQEYYLKYNDSDFNDT